MLPSRVDTVGVTAKDNRLFIEAVLYLYRAGIPFCSLLKITSEKLPSYLTIRRVALGINNQELIEQFNQWGEELMNSDEIG